MFPRKKPTNPSRALRPFNANYQPGNPQSSVAPPLVSASNFHASPYGVTPPFTNTNAAQVAVLNNEEPGIPPDLGVIPEEAAAESGKASNKLAPTQMKDGFQALARIPSTGLRGFHEDPDVVDANKEQDREVPEQEYISLFGPRTGSEQKEREVSEREYVSLFGSPAISKYSSLFARTLPANEGKPQAPSEETPFTAQYPPPQDGDYYGRSEAIDLARYFPHEGAVSTNATTGMPIANFAPPVSTMVPMNMLGLGDSGGAIPVPVPPMVMGPLPPSIDPLAYMWRQPSPKQALGPGESLLPPVQTAVTGDDDNISNTHYDTNKPTCSLNLVCYRSGAKGCDLQQMQCALSTLFPSKDAFEAAISVNKELVYLDDQFFTKMRRLYRFKMCGFFRRWCSLKTLRAFKVLAYTPTTRPTVVPLDDFILQEMMYAYLNPERISTRQDWIEWVFRLRLKDRRHALEFVEGWNTTRIAISGSVPLLSSCLVGIIWSAVGGDVQSAFTVASFLLTISSIILALLAIISSIESSGGLSTSRY